jgi:quercetin dioxygenase-like cupin family protein
MTAELKGAPVAEAFVMADLVQYGEGAVVSRTLMKQPTGTLTLFAFDQGQELSEHTAPFDAVVEALEGEVVLTIGGKAVAAAAGQTVVMPANVPHAVKAVTRLKMLLTMIRM